MNLDFRIAEIADAELRQRPRPLRGASAPSNAGRNATPTQVRAQRQWNPLTGTSAAVFAWNRTDQGWDQAYWPGDMATLRTLTGDALSLQRGQGALTFTRAGTVTRIHESGATDTLAANIAPFDWMTAPSGNSRYCYRADSTSALLLASSNHNVRRAIGSFTAWFNPLSSLSGGITKTLFQCGELRCYITTGAKLRCELRELNAGLTYAEVDVSGWSTGAWHLIGVSWSRVDSRVQIWTDGVLSDTESLSVRPDMLGDTIGIGQGVVAGFPAAGHLLDARVWPIEMTATLFSTLYGVNA